MTHRDLLLYCSTLTFQVVLVVLVYARSLQRRLPFFAVYATLALVCSIGGGLVYRQFGIQSPAAYDAYWTVVALEMVARCAVIAEFCRYRLREYQGIWALVWRLLIVLTIVFLGHAALDTWGQPNRFFIYSLTFERDVNIASVVILLLLLVIRNYYGLSLEPLQRQIAVGLLLYCVIDVLNTTVFRDLLTTYLHSWFSIDHISLWSAIRPQIARGQDFWTTVRFLTYMSSMTIWCLALRKPLPAVEQSPELLPSEVYGRLSPVLNLQLRSFNDRLSEMLKP